jgi:hypothetical protein
VLWRHPPADVTAAETPQLAAPMAAARAPAGTPIDQRQLQPFLTRGWRTLRPMIRNVARHAITVAIPLLRRVALKTERVPLVGRSAHASVQLLNHVRQHGPASTLRMLTHRSPRLGALARLTIRMGRQSQRLVTTMRPAVHVVRRDGLAPAMQRAAAHLKAVTSETMNRSRLSPKGRDIETFNDIRRIRMLQAIAQALTEFMQALQVDQLQSSPLGFVKGILGQLEKAERRPVSEVLADRLRKLTDKHPLWSEAWLELGFLHQDAGEIDLALTAFERAMQGARLRGCDGVDPLAVAAANRGRILAARGLHQEAYENFAYCRSRDSGQAFTAVEQAEQLRRIGQIDMALSSYAVGMGYRGARWNLPEFPHDARKLRFSSLSPWKQIGLHPLVDVPVRSAREQTVATAE